MDQINNDKAGAKTMTNAIEQTRREMYNALELLRGHRPPAYLFDNFEGHLEAHLEELRKDLLFRNELRNNQADTIKTYQDRNEALTEERDTLRNKLQALQMASSTAAEVIRGLRSELEEAREDAVKGSRIEEDPYTLGFNSAGKPCPYAINTIERLHWMDVARDARPYVLVQNNHAPSSWWPFS